MDRLKLSAMIQDIDYRLRNRAAYVSPHMAKILRRRRARLSKILKATPVTQFALFSEQQLKRSR